MNSEPALLRSPAAPGADLGKGFAASTLGDVLDRVSDGVVALDHEWHYTYVNPQAAHIFGREPKELIGRHIWTEFPEGVGQKFHDAYIRALATQQAVFLEEYYPPYERWFENRIYPSPKGLTIYFHDITDRKKAQLRAEGQVQVLESLSRGQPLGETMTVLVRAIETLAPGTICTVLLLERDGRHVRHCAAPSLPAEFARAVDGAAIGPTAGSCGTAAYRREAVFVEDIASDPLWAEWRGLVTPLGLRACWSTPIFDELHALLGTFAIYMRKPGRPTAEHLELLESATHLAAIAITRHRQQSALLRTTERLELAADSGNVGLFDLDLAAGRVYFSPQWKRQLGYAPDELSESVSEWETRIHPEDREETQTRWREFVAPPHRPYQIDFRLRHRDGSYRWILAQAALLRDAKGRPSRVLGSHIDITERKMHEREIERVNRLYAALSHVNQLLVRAASRQELFSEVTKIIVQHGGFLMAWIGWEDEVRGAVVPVAHCGGDNYVELIVIPTGTSDPRGRGPTAIALRENRPYVCNEFERDPTTIPWRAAAAKRGFRSSAVFPIHCGGRPCGVLTVYAGEPDYFQDREQALLQEAAADISFALEHLEEEEGRRAAEASLRESEQRLRGLALRLENIREQERTEIAREIHDVLAQELTKLKIDLVWLSRRAAKLPDGAGETLAPRLAEATEQTNTAITIVQRIATELRPVILDSLGLVAAIEWQAEEFARRTGVACSTQLPPKELVVGRDRATAVFRILQESLTNIARHAHATAVQVELTQEQDAVVLHVGDNGAGIKPEQIADPRSIGLLGMRERAQAFGGTFDIAGSPSGGTTVTVVIPIAA